MVERYRRGKGKHKLLGNHQKCWIWGRNTVLETLNAGRWQILELCVSNVLGESCIESASQRASELEVPFVVESTEALSRRCRSKEHQGYLAKMTSYPYARIEAVLESQHHDPLFAVLDCIQDPHNFGAIVRSASALGVDALFVAKRGQVEVSSLVARSSAGAVNRVEIAQVDDLIGLVRQLKQLEIQSVATSPDAHTMIFEYDFCQPTAIVIGNEGSGIQTALTDACDVKLAIPQHQLESLNAAVSAGILFYEAHRQRL